MPSFKGTIAALAMLASFLSIAEPHAGAVVVVVNKKSEIRKISVEDARALFLGHIRFVDARSRATIGMRDGSLEVHKKFFARIAGMDPREVKINWAKQIFSGNSSPPVSVSGDDTAAKLWVRSTVDGITYIDATSMDDSMKSLLTLP